MQELFFKVLKVEPEEDWATKTGYSTGEAVLIEIAGDRTNKAAAMIAELMLKHRQYSKLLSGFIESLKEKITDEDYGQKIGSSAPFTDSTKQKVGEGEIGSDGDDVMKGKTPQSLPSQGKKGDTKPFDSSVEKSDDKIAKGTPVQKGESQQKETKLGQKGDTQPFDKKIEKVKESKKEEYLRKLTENIINDLKKK
jgi:hypothetical protein